MLLADRYRCELSPVLADWFDKGPWRESGGGEYREPVSPQSLLEPAPEEIWPVLMCCDLLPLISNAAGDWLCVRIDDNNVMSEVVQWYHGAGDWLPWGDHVAEAILFDAALGQSPKASRRHAIPAEDPRPLAKNARGTNDPLLRWALSHVPAETAALFDGRHAGRQIIEGMLESHIAEVAVRCEMAVSLLTHWPREELRPLLKDDQSLDRSLLTRWSFDLDLVPESIRRRLQQETGMSAVQDWESAAKHAQQVCRLAPELAWGWEISGYAAEKLGDVASAIDAYRRGATCSVFTDQSIRLDTHWTTPESAKFSVARLKHHRPDEVQESRYLRSLCHRDVQQRRVETTAYWSELAQQFSQAKQDREAHRCYVAAAWDLGTEPLSTYASLLSCIAESADASEQFGRAELARTHRRCLRERYGV